MKKMAIWAALLALLAACTAPVPIPSDGQRRAPDDQGDEVAERPSAPAGKTNETPDGAPVDEALYDSPEVDAFFEKKLTEAGLPGMSAAVVRGGKTKWAKGYGLSNIAAQKRADKDTVYMLASVSKTVVAVALMQLVEDPASGLTLDTDVSTKLPFIVRNPRFPSTPITVRMLATHTSSLGDHTYVGNLPGDPTVSLASWAQGYVASAVNWDRWRPGTVYDYSNSATALAALVVQSVTGIDFAEYTQKKIFGPLAMKDTSWFLRGIDVAKIATPYDGIAPAFTALEHYGYAEYPCGQLRSSATQMARFLAMMTERGELGGARVLKKETVAEIERPQIPAVEPTQGIFFYYEEHANGVKAIGHNGGDVGVHANMYFDPKDGAGYVLFTNASTSGSFANGGVLVPDAMLNARWELQEKLLNLAKTIP